MEIKLFGIHPLPFWKNHVLFFNLRHQAVSYIESLASHAEWCPCECQLGRPSDLAICGYNEDQPQIGVVASMFYYGK